MSSTINETSEWRAHWPLLVCGMLGISATVIAIYALGQFMPLLEQEFGWSRTEVSMGLSISLIIGFLASPLVGRVADKINVRWLALPGLALVGLSIAAFSVATDNTAVWIALWCLHALASALVAPTVWLALVSAAFERNRSLAIAICLSGTAISTGFGPPVARLLLDNFDWRTAFQLLGLIWVAPSLLFVAVFFFDRRPRTSARNDEAHTADPGGETLRNAFISPTFLKLALAVAVTGITGSAFSIHLVPALSSMGIGLAQAATFAGIAGLASLPGKLAAGVLFDRYGAASVALLVMGLFATASAVFASNIGGATVAVVACALLGVSMGANFALGAILTAKLFSASVFGVIYGTLMSISAIGAALGPLAISAVYDISGSYTPGFWAGVGAAALAAALLTNLSPVRGQLVPAE